MTSAASLACQQVLLHVYYAKHMIGSTIAVCLLRIMRSCSLSFDALFNVPSLGQHMPTKSVGCTIFCVEFRGLLTALCVAPQGFVCMVIEVVHREREGPAERPVQKFCFLHMCPIA